MRDLRTGRRSPGGRFTLAGIAAGAALATILVGCRKHEAPPSSPAPSRAALEAVRERGIDPQSPRGQALALQQEALEPVRAGVRQSLTVGPAVQVLALSGGGQWGAFGAGFLKGWTAKGDRPREFQIVTGTSTGSLIATFAFLGADYDDAVGSAYLGIRGDDDVMDGRFLWGLFSESMKTTKPLRKLLEKNITPAMVAKVAAEAAKGRKLYVGAADLDSGVFKPFDLTAIASRPGEKAWKDYIDALMASTAIPVLFPPVTIEGRTYVDGGVRRNVFLELIVDEMRRTRSERELAPAQATVYCLVNGTLDVGARTVKRKLLDIARRSTDILLDESTDGNLLRIYAQAQKAQLRFLMTRIPPGMCHAVGSTENQFDPDLMHCLHRDAQPFAQRDDAWAAEPPLESGVP